MPHPANNPHAILLMSDVDESFLYGEAGKYDTEGLCKTVDTIRKFQDNTKPPFYAWWNTVRVLGTIKKIARNPALLPILNKFRLDGIIVNNGKQMYVNHTSLMATDWLISLDEAQQDVQWQAHIETTLGWKLDVIDGIITNVLLQTGFNHTTDVIDDNQEQAPFALPLDDLRPPYQIWQNTSATNTLIYYSPLHSALRAAHWHQDSWQASEETIKPITSAIIAKFEKHAIQFETPIIQLKAAHDKTSTNTLNLVRLGPSDVNKGSTTQFALSHLIKPIETIIVVGDDTPDKPLLLNSYTQPKNERSQHLTKTAIICRLPGRSVDESPIKALFSDKALNGIPSVSGNISQALTEAYENATR